jgi:hypothetical protein
MNTDATSLNRLHDIILPAPAPWWPPAPGWYWVLGFLLVLLLVLVLRFFLHWQRNRYRREALKELAGYESAPQDPKERSGAVTALAELLKRTALSAWPREEVASLTGTPWLEFLDQTAKMKFFSEDAGAVLEQVSYNPRASLPDANGVSALVRQVRVWIRRHRVDLDPARNPSRPRPRNADVQPRTRTRTRDENEEDQGSC